ncbi:MAG: hypothetical protein IT428_12935 [Planctomycetaceae bacterium]|nr:hypothetical protein [Planctomycetaceae bacterium]
MSKRSRPVPPPPVAPLTPDNRQSFGWMASGAAWVIGFCLYFSSSVLPNNPEWSRDILWLLLPDYYKSWFFSAPPEGAIGSGWQYLPQRFDLLAVAAAILISAMSVGRLTLRWLYRAVANGVRINSAEGVVFSAGLGLSLTSLVTLLIGLCGGLQRIIFLPLLAIVVLAEAALSLRESRRRAVESRAGPIALPDTETPSVAFRLACLTGMAPFFFAMLLGAMIPDSDFDVREYHLQGPKEYYLAGRIQFLEHNVYTSFPFLTEMLALLGMVLRGDWYRGALAGKVVLMSFAPFTALAAYCVARRLASPAAGWLAALFWLSTPWAYRISIIAYAEGGLSFFLAATVLAALRAMWIDRGTPAAGRSVILTGLLSGSAMACKYPGVLSVVIPIGLFQTIQAFRSPPSTTPAPGPGARLKPALVIAALFSLGVLITIGPWLLKNLTETGNPVYPLLYRVFGGRDWDSAMNAKWNRAHSPDDYDVTKLWFWLTDVSARNDWLSPLLYAFAPLSLLSTERRRPILMLWAYVAWLFATWWLFTHRLDRFWVPMLPAVAMLAGVGACRFDSPLWRLLRNGVIVLCLAFNLRMITSGLSGPNGYLIDLDDARPRVAGPSFTYLNSKLPPGSQVLCVGEAEVFDLTVPVVYNTVFDRSIFQEWTADPSSTTNEKDLKFRDPHEIHERLLAEGITHLFVNWAEILRYRTSYGYTDYVTPQRFLDLRQQGILGKPTTLALQPWDTLGDREKDELNRWAPSLRTRVAGPTGLVDGWIATEIYEVTPEFSTSP